MSVIDLGLRGGFIKPDKDKCFLTIGKKNIIAMAVHLGVRFSQNYIGREIQIYWSAYTWLRVSRWETHIHILTLKCYHDQNFMSRMKQTYVLYSLSDVAVPVLVTEMKFGPHKLKILSLEK